MEAESTCPYCGEPITLWIDEGSVRDEAARATARGGVEVTGPARRSRSRRLPSDVVAELERAAGQKRSPYLERRLREARAAFEVERYRDAVRILGPLASEVPSAPGESLSAAKR